MEGDELEFAAFEGSILIEHVNRQRMLQHFDLARFLAMLGLEGLGYDDMLYALTDAKLVVEDGQGGHHVKTVMALTCATGLARYPALRDRGVAVVGYRGTDRSAARIDHGLLRRGYALDFAAATRRTAEWIDLQCYDAEDGAKSPNADIPDTAIAAVILNAIVHQDFALPGPRPQVSLYLDRIEISNAGMPPIPADRFIDGAREKRNPALARLMLHACTPEDEPQGMRRVMLAIEDAALPPPLFAAADGVSIVTLYPPRGFAGWTPAERVRACFQHAQFRNRRHEAITAASLRVRLGLPEDATEQAAAVIRETLAAGLIKPRGEDEEYVPAYA